MQFKQPLTVKGLQKFVGVVNFCHQFIPAAVKMMSPLCSALAGKPKTLEWSEPMVAAFQDTKAALARAVMLVHPCSNAPTSLTVDASEQATLSILQPTTASPREEVQCFRPGVITLPWGEAFLIFPQGPGVCCIYRPQTSHFLHGQNIRSMV